MLLADMFTRPAQWTEYADTRYAYAESLAYAIKGNADDNYASQRLCVVGGMYAIVTQTSVGLYAQIEPGIILAVNESDLESIRAL